MGKIWGWEKNLDGVRLSRRPREDGGKRKGKNNGSINFSGM